MSELEDGGERRSAEDCTRIVPANRVTDFQHITI